MTDYEGKQWRNFCDATLSKYEGRIDEFTFWVEVVELIDKRGNVYMDKLPRIAINFK